MLSEFQAKSPNVGNVTAGVGSDTLLLKISQDAYAGDALFTISVDGKQIGDTFVAKGDHGGAYSTLTLLGDWTDGDHKLSVNFLNDRFDGTPSTDRNLYIESVSYNGKLITSSSTEMLSAGTSNFGFTATASKGELPNVGNVTAGVGSDTLLLKISQDAYAGDALFTISVDGKQIGDTFVAKGDHGGAYSTLTLLGDWTDGDHKLSVNFLNDRFDGTPSTDRNLYIESVSYNGKLITSSSTEMLSAGTSNFGFTATASKGELPNVGNVTAGVGSDTLLLKISQDAYAGDALFTISVDGKQIGDTFVAKGDHGGAYSTLTLLGDWTDGDHKLSVNFLNDRFDGTPSTDRNLYIESVSYNGKLITSSSTEMLSAGTSNFGFTATASKGELPNVGTATKTGVYVGNNSADVAQFEKWLGAPVDAVLGYTGDKTWNDMNPTWQLMNQFIGGAQREILWSIPLFPKESSLEAIMRGEGYETFKDFAETILSSRSSDDGDIYVRTAWEVGAEWFWWSQQALDNPDAFKLAFGNFASAFHEVSNRFKIVWDSAGDRGDVSVFYPGDEHVDVISRDFYWLPQWQGNNPSAAFAKLRNDPFGLQWVENFAAAHNKPTAYSEWGAPAGYDASDFIALAKAWFSDPSHNVLYQTYWNSDADYPGKISDDSDIATGDAYKAAFGDSIGKISDDSDIATGDAYKAASGDNIM